jgi:hypothetical protein
VVDEEAAAVLDHDGQREETAVVQGVGVDGVAGVALVTGETPAGKEGDLFKPCLHEQ